MGQAFFQFLGFEPENVSKNYDILENNIQRLKKQGGLGQSVSLKQLENNRVVIKGLKDEDKSKLMQYFRKNIPESLKLRQTPTQIQFLLTKEEKKPKSIKEKCKAFEKDPTKNPFNKTNRGKHMVPNKYTENLLKELCKNSKEFCEKKKNNKKISQKYCTEIGETVNSYYQGKCKAFEADRTKNPFNKTNRGKHMVPNKYTENLLEDLCKNPTQFCEKKKNNKRISQKYCVEEIIKLQEQAREQIKQIKKKIQ